MEESEAAIQMLSKMADRVKQDEDVKENLPDETPTESK